MAELDQKRWLTIKQVAERLPIGERTILRELKKGSLPGCRFGKKWLIEEGELHAYMRRLALASVAQST
jgi:excisionase family DNA binding protein